MVGQVGVALQVAPHLHGVVDDLLLGAGAVGLQHLAGVGIGEDRLDPGGDVAGIKADRPGGRDGGQQRVADAVFRDQRAHLRVQRLIMGRAIFAGVEQREGPFLLRDQGRGAIGGVGDHGHPAPVCAAASSEP
jgi:hypothetical protein